MSLNWPKSGPSSSPQFQMSGIPFVSSSIRAFGKAGGSIVRVTFPFVTKNFRIENIEGSGTRDLRVGFTENGVLETETKNYFIVARGKKSDELDLRVKELFFVGDHNTHTVDFAVYASLTTIPASEFPVLTGSIVNGVTSFEGVG